MTTQPRSLLRPLAQPVSMERPQSEGWFDWAVAATSAWVVGGMYVDLWAHAHGFADTTFFTPWHAVLYSGLLAVIVVLCAGTGLNVLRGHHWMRATPAGYVLSLLGAAVFALAGFSDMVWHTLLGIEVNIEALLSPPHLLLAVGAFLMFSGPLASAWGRTDLAKGRAPVTALLSALYILALLSFFTQYAHPIAEPVAAYAGRNNWRNSTIGVASFLLQSGLLSGIALLLLRRWRLPFGAVTVLFVVYTGLMGVVDDNYLFMLPAAIAGLIVDTLIAALRPSAARVWAVRLVAFLLPLAFFACYLGGLALSGGLAWSMAMWSGATFLAAIVGLLISFLVFPPALPAESGNI